MKILITGVNGQVGHALMRELTDHELIGLTRQDCDLTKPDQIRQVIDQHQPDLIINPAAYTKVDQAEDEPELAFQINRDAPKVMAEKAREYNIPLIHFSTDYVFDGKKRDHYLETDVTNPLNIYGRSKREGEEEIQTVGGHYYIFRTSWVYSNIGNNFFLKIIHLMQTSKVLKIVDDQIGVPTTSSFLAQNIQKIITMIKEDNSGIYHLVPNGYCSYFEFAKKIIILTDPKNTKTNLYAIKSNVYPSNIKRPKNNILNNDKIKKVFNLSFPDWEVGLKQVILES